MSNIRTLLKYFYKPILPWNLGFTLTAIFFIGTYGARVTGFMFFWKLIGYVSTIFLQSYTAKNVYMYYRNAGYSIKRMYVYAFAIDMAIFIIMLILLFTASHLVAPHHHVHTKSR
jgi:hypothetical protein